MFVENKDSESASCPSAYLSFNIPAVDVDIRGPRTNTILGNHKCRQWNGMDSCEWQTPSGNVANDRICSGSRRGGLRDLLSLLACESSYYPACLGLWLPKLSKRGPLLHSEHVPAPQRAQGSSPGDGGGREAD